MTPAEQARMAALERVAEAARAYRAEESGPTYHAGRLFDARAVVDQAFAALDAIPAPTPEPEGKRRAIQIHSISSGPDNTYALYVLMDDGTIWERCRGEWEEITLPATMEPKP